MLSIIFGLILIGFTVCACLPQVLGWGEQILWCLKGVLPVLAAVVGVAAVLIGFTDLQDKKEARKAEKDAAEAAEKDKASETKND